jgi:hypothetical protein
VKLSQVPPGARTTFYEGWSAQPVADAILECRGRVEPDRLRDAAKPARSRGLLTTAEWRRVTRGLRS